MPRPSGGNCDRSKMRSFRSITIVGLGLIGGSLAAACRKAFPRANIKGITRNPSALARAKKRGWIHEGYSDLNQAFARAGTRSPRPKQGGATPPLPLIILCTPVDTLKNFLQQLDRLAPPGTVVTDTGSVKGFLVRWAERKKWKRIQFVGAHPLAGSHEQGFGAAREHLFDKALVFVTPGKRTSGRALGEVKEFWKKISRKVLVLSPELHDRLTAEISHFPHLLATLLVESVSPKSLQAAASGFLDTTRIAQGDPNLWAPILLENRLEINRVLKSFEGNLKRVQKILQDGKISALKRLLDRSKKRRQALEIGV